MTFTDLCVIQYRNICIKQQVISLFIQFLHLLCLFPAGPSGSVITLTGSGFGNDSQLITITINGVPCNVSTVSDTQVQFAAGSNPGATYPVMLHHQVKGYAQSGVVFTYELTLSSVQPSEGKQY